MKQIIFEYYGAFVVVEKSGDKWDFVIINPKTQNEIHCGFDCRTYDDAAGDARAFLQSYFVYHTI